MLRSFSGALRPLMIISALQRFTARCGYSRRPVLDRHDFGDGRARYEESSDDHHDHLIDVHSGKVIEFHDEEVEELQRKIAEKHGFKLVDHRMELYGVPLEDASDS